MADIKKYMDKRAWHRIIARDIEARGETFDSLKILAIYSSESKKGKKLIVNYMTEQGIGSYRTSFGYFSAEIEGLESIFREDAICQLLE